MSRYIVRLPSGDATLTRVGGKGVNLLELARAGFAVPPGFVIATDAYRTFVEANHLQSSIVAHANRLSRAEPSMLETIAGEIRMLFEQGTMPAEVATETITTYHAFLANADTSAPSDPAVAVRSSATAEDLPGLSFAGQQESYLNIVGEQALLAAVRRCWASLWTARAMVYRAHNHIPPGAVALAVVVQVLIPAEVSGVLFTANPLTGKRRQAVIDASPGLGEAIVSGVVTPDHFVVNTLTGELVERRLGDRRVVIRPAIGGGTQRIEQTEHRQEICLSADQVQRIAALGVQVETHYGAPQDIEWAIDAAGALWLLQARPITTLFPLPADAPSSDETLRVYLSFNVQQGTYRPFTPMGCSAIRLLVSALATFAGFPPPDPLQGPRYVTEAASRLFLDVTAPLRRSFGRTLLAQTMAQAEVHAATIFQQLVSDPRLSLLPTPRWLLFRTIVRLLVRSPMLWYVLQALLSPAAARARLQRFADTLRREGKVAADASSSARLTVIERLFFDISPRLMTSVSPVMLSAMISFSMAGNLLRDLATEGECLLVLRGAPANPTTEMNLALWALAQQVRADPSTVHLLHNTPPAQLAAHYRKGQLPDRFQHDLANFLATYGHRSVAELDLGQPRWSEDPTYLFGLLASYLQTEDPAQAPDVQFQCAIQEAEAMVTELTRRAQRKGWLRGLLVGFCLHRARALSGLREMPRFCLALLLARARTLFWPVGEELVQAKRLEAADDIFFLTLPEAHAALAGTDVRRVIRERRASYTRELARRHVPLVLLSDGTEPSTLPQEVTAADMTLQGVPASPGVITAPVRVILDPTDVSLQPGEILVAPSTDPGWTPLFLTAGGLVMEMGGAMAHGAIVAREYGIPAVVGVYRATTRLHTGQHVRVDGSSGHVTVIEGHGQD